MAKVLKGDFSRRSKAAQAKPSGDRPVPSYQLKISLVFSDPLIWRRLRVPGSMTLAGLHRTIQACMNWSDSETHQFLVGKIFYSPGFGIKSEDLMQRQSKYDEAQFELHQLEESMRFIFTYLYDGGEGWELEITLEEVLEQGATADHPVLLDGEYGCPPEDVGDIHQYLALLYALEQSGTDPSEIKLEVPGEDDFYPHLFDVEAINDSLKKIV
jgi:hypothetical protein